MCTELLAVRTTRLDPRSLSRFLLDRRAPPDHVNNYDKRLGEFNKRICFNQLREVSVNLMSFNFLPSWLIAWCEYLMLKYFNFNLGYFEMDNSINAYSQTPIRLRFKNRMTSQIASLVPYWLRFFAKHQTLQIESYLLNKSKTQKVQCLIISKCAFKWISNTRSIWLYYKTNMWFQTDYKWPLRAHKFFATRLPLIREVQHCHYLH